MASYFEVF